MPKDGAVPPAAASARPARRCRAATSAAGPSHVTGADESQGRRRGARGKTSAKERKKPSKDSAEDKAGDTGPWPSLPHTVLCQVLALLDHEDVVSVGQTCRSWRETALHRDVWRKRVLEYQVTDYRSRHFSYGWHDNAKRFSRIARFAPCAAKVSCNRGMKPAARKALFTQSKCQPKEVEVNRGRVAAAKYLRKWKDGIEDVTLLNPSLECLQAAISAPKLASLVVKFKPNYNNTYEVPSYEGPSSATLKKLVFLRDVHFAAVDSLIRAHAATLEDVYAFCFPGTALAVCARLRRLTLDVDPETQGEELLALLRGKGPLDHLAFKSFGFHNADPCVALRRRLKDEGLVQQDVTVTCWACERGGPWHDDLHRLRSPRRRDDALYYN